MERRPYPETPSVAGSKYVIFAYNGSGRPLPGALRFLEGRFTLDSHNKPSVHEAEASRVPARFVVWGLVPPSMADFASRDLL